jgi:hypothetical protein
MQNKFKIKPAKKRSVLERVGFWFEKKLKLENYFEEGFPCSTCQRSFS